MSKISYDKRLRKITKICLPISIWFLKLTLVLNWCSFLPQTLQTTCSIRCVSERCTCTIFWPSEILWCVAKCLLKDDDDVQRQAKSLYCTANKLRGTFDQFSPAVKNTLLWAYCMPMYACQLWSKYTQTNMKRLRAVYTNAYRNMHCISQKCTCSPTPS